MYKNSLNTLCKGGIWTINHYSQSDVRYTQWNGELNSFFIIIIIFSTFMNKNQLNENKKKTATINLQIFI